MINPNNITDYNRSAAALEEFLLFCVCVAGKNSNTQAKKLAQLLGVTESPLLKMHLLHLEGKLYDALAAVKMGQYGRISKAFVDASLLASKKPVASWTLDDLKSVRGVGPKTARFFLLHTRKDCAHVVLDVHILRYLRTHPTHGVSSLPLQTPSEPAYSRIESAARAVIREDYPEKEFTMAQADLEIWKKARA